MYLVRTSMSATTVRDRKQAEIDFHNKRAQDRVSYGRSEFERRYANKKLYSITRRTKHIMADWMRRYGRGATALDYCCGQGLTAIELAKHGANVYGIDIADEEIATARIQADAAGYSTTTHFTVMDAEHLSFPDDTFDLIVCNGVLHHLDLQNAYPELARVLKPRGRILCLEALGYNPAINLYRKLTPHLRTKWETHHILTLRQVDQAREFFETIEIQFLYFFSIAAIPFRKTRAFNSILNVLEAFDDFVLRIPFVQLMAWQMVFELSAPQHGLRMAAASGRADVTSS